MKNRKIFWIFIILFCIVILAGFFTIKYVKEKQKNEEIQEYV